MRNYSLCYLDALGRTQRSEFLPFENNKNAADFARIGIISNAIVEVWKDDDLVVRLYQKNCPPGAEKATTAFVRADQHESLQRWDNEGGGMRTPPIFEAAS